MPPGQALLHVVGLLLLTCVAADEVSASSILETSFRDILGRLGTPAIPSTFGGGGMGTAMAASGRRLDELTNPRSMPSLSPAEPRLP
jgi:hypothetical protein